MKRKQMPQFMNQDWYPTLLKNLMYEFLTWFVHFVKAAKPFVSVVNEGLEYSKVNKIINIELNIGAGFETLKPFINQDIVVLDRTLERFDTNYDGLYTFINCFHQFNSENATNILTEISQKNHPVAVLEGNNNSLLQIFGMTIIVPLTILLTAPFVKPFRFSRLIFTYLVPVLPIVTFIDGSLALMKLYSPEDLDELVSKIKVSKYQWKSGKLDNGRGGKIIYLLGHPQQ